MRPPARVAVGRVLVRLADSVIDYHSRPVPRPRVDPRLPTMPAVPRVLEMARYNLSCLEFAVGRDRWLRAWAVASLRVLLLVLCPLLALPVVAVVAVPVFGSLASIAASLAETARSLAMFLLWSIAVFVLLPLFLGLIGVLWKRAERARCDRAGGRAARRKYVDSRAQLSD